MFFKKKKETDVDVLQKIKDKIAEDGQKTSNNTKKTTTASAANEELDVDNKSEGESTSNDDVAEIGRSVLEHVSQIVDKAIQDNNDKQDQFENSLESDFLNDMLAVANTPVTESVKSNSTNSDEAEVAETNINAIDVSEDDDDDVDDFNFGDDIDDDDNLQKDEDSLLDDEEDNTGEMDTLVIGGASTEGQEGRADKQEQKPTEYTANIDGFKPNKREEKSIPHISNDETKHEEAKTLAKNNEDDLLSDDDSDLENSTNEEVEFANVSNIASSVGNIADKSVLSDRQSDNHNNRNFDTKEDNITFPNVPKIVKKDAPAKSNVERTSKTDDEEYDKGLSLSGSDNDITQIARQNYSDRKMDMGISQQTQKGVKTSITDLIENVKNQIMQNNRSVASRGSRADGGKTMEQFVADLVQPHIVRYLDGNLERIVNNIVQKEIKKIIDEVDSE